MMRAQPPPPPPPPPPRTSEYGWSDEADDPNPSTTTATTATKNAAVQLFTPKDLVVLVLSEEEDDNNNNKAITIHLSSDMTVDLLSNCLTQACMASSIRVSTPIVGLFQGHCFYSLQHILETIQNDATICTTQQQQQQQQQQQYGTSSSLTYSLFPPPAPVRTRDSSLGSWILFLLPILLGIYLAHLLLSTMDHPSSILPGIQQLYQTFWLHPIQELYLQGPTPFGWEGLSMLEICSRLSHFGGVDFWSRHEEECLALIEQRQEILGKRLGVPLLMGLGVWFLLWMIQRIVRWLRKKEEVDPRMVEVYHAVQTILQVARNTENGSSKKKR